MVYKPVYKRYLAQLMAEDEFDCDVKVPKNIIVGYTVYHEGTRLGVMFARKFHEFTTIDAYADYKGNDMIKYSIEAGEWLIKQLNLKEVYIMHEVKRLNIIALARALHFKRVGYSNDGIYLLWRRKND